MTDYEYRIRPSDVCVVEVRRISTKPRTSHTRGHGWHQYMECYRPADADRILSMLEPENVWAQVTR